MRDVCDEYGLEVGNRMANVSAKVYKPPLLEFGDRSISSEDREGKGGNVNLRGRTFFKAANVGNFLIINCSRASENNIRDMANALQKVGRNFGMKFDDYRIQQEIGWIFSARISHMYSVSYV